MSEPVYVVAHVEARPGYEDALRSALLKLVVAGKAEPGFIRYDLHEDTVKAGHFVFYEIWQDQASLAVHGSTPQMTDHVESTKHWVSSVTIATLRKLNG